MSNTKNDLKTEPDERDLLRVCKQFMEWLDNGTLVRNIEKDHNPDWSIQLLDLVYKLQEAQRIIDECEKRLE